MIPSNFEEALDVLQSATEAGDVFESDVDSGPAAYRAWVKLVHPDRVPRERAEAAHWAFTRLSELWAAARAGLTVTGAVDRYLVGSPLASDEVATYIEAGRQADPGADDVVLKVARAPVDNDLLWREASALGRLRRTAEERHLAYLPKLLDALTYREHATGADRAVNVVDRLAGFVSLATVRAAYPDGVDPRDAAWMWRRLLVALGTVHRAGYVHGAILPENVLIHPAEHGLVVVNWCYGVKLSTVDRVPAVLERYRDWYPREILDRQRPAPASDIYLATQCMVALIRDQAPAALRRFARGCLVGTLDGRPDDAWRLLAELDAVLARLFGPRRFRPFAMPATAPAWPRQPTPGNNRY